MRQIVVLLAVMIFLLCGFNSCCPRPMTSAEQRDSTHVEYRDRWRERVIRDTTYVRDSVMIRERGDTVTVYRDRYHYIDRYLKDTVRVTDTIFETVYKDRTQVVKKTHIPRFFWWCFGIALAAVGYIMFYFLKRMSK